MKRVFSCCSVVFVHNLPEYLDKGLTFEKYVRLEFKDMKNCSEMGQCKTIYFVEYYNNSWRTGNETSTKLFSHRDQIRDLVSNPF